MVSPSQNDPQPAEPALSEKIFEHRARPGGANFQLGQRAGWSGPSQVHYIRTSRDDSHGMIQQSQCARPPVHWQLRARPAVVARAAALVMGSLDSRALRRSTVKSLCWPIEHSKIRAGAVSTVTHMPKVLCCIPRPGAGLCTLASAENSLPPGSHSEKFVLAHSGWHRTQQNQGRRYVNTYAELARCSLWLYSPARGRLALPLSGSSPPLVVRVSKSD